ncbi:hypothetical protein BH09ACT8_BH09ACT8_46910 [soil metagenome]
MPPRRRGDPRWGHRARRPAGGADPQRRHSDIRPRARTRPRIPLHTLGETCRVRPHARHDVPLPRLRPPRRPHDIDHTLPWPYGATHPSDLKCYCRKHHNLKTWWIGDWADQQSPDGTVIVTSPTGKTYTTKPVSSLLFSGWNTVTSTSPPRGTPPTRPPGCDAPTTKRKRTRTQDHAYRIKAERALNAAHNAATQNPAPANHRPHTWETNTHTTEDDDEPPF